MFKLQRTFFKSSPKLPVLLMPGTVVPGTADSIIFPKNKGNKLVVNADNPMNINARTNFARNGLRYLNSTNACERFSRDILAFGGSSGSLLNLRDVAIANYIKCMNNLFCPAAKLSFLKKHKCFFYSFLFYISCVTLNLNV